MEEKKEKNYYWIIPVVIGVFALIGLGIFVFIVSIFSVVNTSLKIVSKDIQGGWLCDGTLNVDINKNTLNTYSSNRADVVNATYKVNGFTTTNGHNEYELIKKINKVSGNIYNQSGKYKILMDSYNKNQMEIINTQTNKSIKCIKR